MISFHCGVLQRCEKHLHHLALRGTRQLYALEEFLPALGGLNAKHLALQCVLHHVTAEKRKQDAHLTTKNVFVLYDSVTHVREKCLLKIYISALAKE